MFRASTNKKQAPRFVGAALQELLITIEPTGKSANKKGISDGPDIRYRPRNQ